jgi:hypothetical protein
MRSAYASHVALMNQKFTLELESEDLSIAPDLPNI